MRKVFYLFYYIAHMKKQKAVQEAERTEMKIVGRNEDIDIKSKTIHNSL